MSISLYLRRFLSLGCVVVLAQTVCANSDLSAAEADTIVKEDIASAQVMVEICPALVGSESVIQNKVKAIATEYLADLSNKQMTFESLQKDAEYVEILKAARVDTQQTSKDEQTEVCQEIINM